MLDWVGLTLTMERLGELIQALSATCLKLLESLR